MLIRKSWVQEEAGETGDTGTGAPATGGTDMLSVIDNALGYKAPEGETEAPASEAAPESTPEAGEGQPTEGAEAADPAKKPEEKKPEEGPKDLKSLELTDQDKRAMKQATAARYQEVLSIAKTERQAREAAEAQAQALAQSRDAILTVMKETHTTEQDLGALLEFNRLTKTGRPEDLKAALEVVNTQRLHLMKALGVQGDGYDPLTEHKDLLQDVEDQRVTRERALEIAGARKSEAIRRQNEQRQAQSGQQAQQAQQVQEQALSGIEKWSAEMASTDIDFKAKEAILVPEITAIVRENPPSTWLPMIKTAYRLITVKKAQEAVPGAGPKPLRASGAKPGGAAPTSMMEAIDQKLGYAKT